MYQAIKNFFFRKKTPKKNKPGNENQNQPRQVPKDSKSNAKSFDDDPEFQEIRPASIDLESPGVPKGILTLKDLPQPKWTVFEDANTWEPEEHTVLYCMNGQDNVPTRVKLENGFVYYISQNRSPGHKEQGQDCMASASQDNWEVHVLCDGHDKVGHMVALGVCQQLPKIMLRKIYERNSANPKLQDEEIADELIDEAFEECATVVCWTRADITVGLWVKVFEGQFADKPGFVKEVVDKETVKVAIIDENGYHLPELPISALKRSRYTGGCTCVCLIRNKVTKLCKVGITGDSRFMILPAISHEDEILTPQMGLDDPISGKCSAGLVTPAHNVFNQSEKARLERDYRGMYEFDGNFLVNPITKFAIQPTRGFGDFDMFGTGYTHKPQITRSFTLPPNGLIMTASDGVFDHHVWADEEIVSCLDKFLQDGLTNVQICDRMYRETLERSHEGGYVDDISLFVFVEPNVATKVDASKSKTNTGNETLPRQKGVKPRSKQDRFTIERGAKAFTDLSERLQQIRAQKGEESEKIAIEEIVNEHDDVREGLGNVLGNLAKSSKVDPTAVLSKSGIDLGRNHRTSSATSKGNGDYDDA